jgi:LysR family nitrogen assimilation transcriptional regulator
VTEAGRKLEEMGDFILRYMAEIKPSLAQTASEPSGSVILGLPPSLAFLLAPRLVEVARQRHPLLRLRIIEGLSIFLTDWLELGRIDLALLTDHGPLPSIDRRELAVEDMVFVASPALFGPPRESMRLDEITNYPLMVTHGFRSVLEPWLHQRNVEPHYEMELDSIPILKEMLLRGLCGSVVPYSMVAEETQAGQLMAARFTDPRIMRRIMLARPNKRPDTVTTTAVVALIEEEVSKLPSDIFQSPSADSQAGQPAA